MAKKASQLWPSGADCVEKVPMCRILAFPNMKGISFFLFTEKQRVNERSSLSEVTPVKYMDSYFSGGGGGGGTKNKARKNVLQKERNCPRLPLLTIKSKIQIIL